MMTGGTPILGNSQIIIDSTHEVQTSEMSQVSAYKWGSQPTVAILNLLWRSILHEHGFAPAGASAEGIPGHSAEAL